MEVTLIHDSVYKLDSKLRVGAIVYDGAADMQLWPGRGPDSDLKEAYGDDLQKALDAEYKQLGGEPLPIGTVVRVKPGRLHCDFLAWVVTRQPEPGSERSPAPNEDAIKAATIAAIEFVAERNVKRVGFIALGAGIEELHRQERLVAVASAAIEHNEKLFAEKKTIEIDEILVCESMITHFKKVRTKLRGIAKAKAKAAAPKKTTKKRASRKSKIPTLSPAEIETRRGSTDAYSMNKTYLVNDWFLHSKFGMGRVEELPLPGACVVLFEDGKTRRMVHGRPAS